jgi:glycosyltransferase involved in cell wall biosynthesis
MNKLRIVHTIAGLHPAGGGPSRTVTNLTDSLASLSDLSIALICQSSMDEPNVPSANQAVERHYADATPFLLGKLGLPMRQALRKNWIQSIPDLFHDHGLWMPSNHWVANLARATNTPLIIQPRGMLEPWAMNYKVWKKKLAMRLYQRRNLQTANVLVATAAAEYDNLRSLGLRQPIAVIPNGVFFQQNSSQQAMTRITQKRTRTVLFLSRVQRKKGLLNLVDAWAKIGIEGWRLQIAGPDEGGHLAEVLVRANQVGVASGVDYLGVVDGIAKSQLYRSADLFVLPTFSENFGVVVAEALAHGLPVITTRNAPWVDLATYDCGWWIDVGVDPLVAALREAMTLSDAERQAMGTRGQDYVRRYDWGDIAKQTANVYRWALGRDPRPECVQLD